jgi:hypothetical protein
MLTALVMYINVYRNRRASRTQSIEPGTAPVAQSLNPLGPLPPRLVICTGCMQANRGQLYEVRLQTCWQTHNTCCAYFRPHL